MARPKKDKLKEVDTEVITDSLITSVVDNSEQESKQHILEDVPTEQLVEKHSKPVSTDKNIQEPRFYPKADNDEMDRYFRVIYNREEAMRISPMITHQRDLQLWGVHQYDANGSKNSFARSFYFRELNNAQHAVAYAQGLLV